MDHDQSERGQKLFIRTLLFPIHVELILMLFKFQQCLAVNVNLSHSLTTNGAALGPESRRLASDFRPDQIAQDMVCAERPLSRCDLLFQS